MKFVYIVLPLLMAPLFLEAAQAEENKILYWVAPMDSSYKKDKPGKSPMGMDLVPVYAKDTNSRPQHLGGLAINPATLQTMNVQTTQAQKKSLGAMTQGYGKLTENMANRQTLSARADGWIDTMAIHGVGEGVSKGDALFTIYSPEILAAQKDFLSATSPGRQHATKQRLLALGMQEKAITSLGNRKEAFLNVPFYAPISGYVSHIDAHNGAAVKSGAPLMVLDDPSTLWADVAINSSDVVHLNDTTKATLTLVDTGETVPAEIKLIHPTLDDTTRTGNLRLLVENPNGTLKAGQYADVTLTTDVKQRLVVPETALLHSKQGYKVIVAAGDGQFYPQSVQIGVRGGEGMVEITEGLDAQTSLVTNGQFLIDADSNLSNAGAHMSEEDDNGEK